MVTGLRRRTMKLVDRRPSLTPSNIAPPSGSMNSAVEVMNPHRRAPAPCP